MKIKNNKKNKIKYILFKKTECRSSLLGRESNR